MKILLLLVAFCLTGCDDVTFNNPYPASANDSKILYSSFSGRPKTLDPAQSYASNEALFTAQIYEPPLQYDYLKRPFELIPLTASKLPVVKYYDSNNKEIQSQQTSLIHHTTYTISIVKGVKFQPHPAFATKRDGTYIYHNLSEEQFAEFNINGIDDFKHSGTRELTASDYIYEIKRLAHPVIKSPIYGVMAKYILGFNEFGDNLSKMKNIYSTNILTSVKELNIKGVKLVDRYTYEITIKGVYPQFQYWLAMGFFAPIPWEGDVFYDNPVLLDHNISFAWFPIGTGPFMLTENNPNSKMVLTKNPNFREEIFPSLKGYKIKFRKLKHFKNKSLPLIDKAIFSLEKEAIPRWNKFLQWYYDYSSISSDSFDQAIQINSDGSPTLTKSLEHKNINLQTTVAPTIFYLAFNMLDPIVGGKSKKARYLRHAISIAVNFEEFISIFSNGRGEAALGPVPPSILAYTESSKNEFVYNFKDKIASRKTIVVAKKLLAKAGFPNGIDAKTGKPLIINYDVAMSGGPDDKERFNWMRKQFKKLGISLNIRATHYNRFQDKVRDGNVQVFMQGWHADYPDPENFLFLLYGPNSKAIYGGENSTNYSNPKFDELFEKMQTSNSVIERDKLARRMIKIVQKDAPWAFGLHPRNYILSHVWNNYAKPSEISYNTLKYKFVDINQRAKLRTAWNSPRFLPLLMLSLLFALAVFPVILIYRKHKYQPKYKSQ